MNGDYDYKRDFLMTKEFSELSGVSEQMLRNLDKDGLFHPFTHGEGVKSQYRYYSPVQVSTLRMILVLGEIGMKRNEMKDLKESRTIEEMDRVFFNSQRKMYDLYNSFMDTFSVVQVYSELLSEASRVRVSDMFVIDSIQGKHIILGDKNIYTDGVGPWQKFIHFLKAPHEPAIRTEFPIGGFFESMENFVKTPSLPARFYSYDPNGYDVIPQGSYLTGYTRGYYGQTNDLPERLMAYAKKHGYTFSGPVYNIHIADEISVKNPNQYLLKVSAAVKRKRSGLRHGLNVKDTL